MSSGERLIQDETENFKDNDYVSRTGQSSIPVQSDDAKIEEPLAGDQDTDAQLGMYPTFHSKCWLIKLLVLIIPTEKDDKEAIDKSNIIEERTRHAAKPGQFREPDDEEGLGPKEEM